MSIGIIPIRAKSSRFPNKTFALLGGKPLIWWTIEQAINSRLTKVVVVSSCKHVKQYVKDNYLSVEFIERPAKLEYVKSKVFDTIEWLRSVHTHRYYQNFGMLLQITNPTRTVDDINLALETVNTKFCSSVVSVVDVDDIHPYRMFLDKEPYIKPFSETFKTTLTQDLPKMWLRDGSIYCWKWDNGFYDRSLMPQPISKLVIEPERSIRIDTPEDLEKARRYMAKVGRLA